MDLDVIWTDLNRKIPYLRNFFRTEYQPYLNTGCTILLGWLVVSTIFHLVRLFFAHLTTGIIAIILFCPTTMKWLFSDRLGYDLEIIFNDLGDKMKRLLNHFQSQYCK